MCFSTGYLNGAVGKGRKGFRYCKGRDEDHNIADAPCNSKTVINANASDIDRYPGRYSDHQYNARLLAEVFTTLHS